MHHVTALVTRDSHALGGVTFGVSHGTPSRPVPTRPIYISYRALRVGDSSVQISEQTNLCNVRDRLAW